MKNQVETISDYEKKMKTKDNINFAIYFFLLFAFDLPFNALITCIIDVVFAALFYLIPTIKRESILKDYQKNKCFIENMELFQEGLKEDMGIYTNLNKKTKQTIDSLIEKKNNQEYEKEPILREPTLNTIDKVSHNQFNDIYELLLKNKEFDKYYEQESPKKRVLTKEEK